MSLATLELINSWFAWRRQFEITDTDHSEGAGGEDVHFQVPICVKQFLIRLIGHNG